MSEKEDALAKFGREMQRFLDVRADEVWQAGRIAGSNEILATRKMLAERRADIFQQRWTRLQEWIREQQGGMGALASRGVPDAYAELRILQTVMFKMTEIERQPLAADEEPEHARPE